MGHAYVSCFLLFMCFGPKMCKIVPGGLADLVRIRAPGTTKSNDFAKCVHCFVPYFLSKEVCRSYSFL